MSLSPTEIEMLQLLARGYSLAEISIAFSISEDVTAFRYDALAARYGTNSRTETVIAAVSRGDISEQEIGALGSP